MFDSLFQEAFPILIDRVVLFFLTCLVSGVCSDKSWPKRSCKTLAISTKKARREDTEVLWGSVPLCSFWFADAQNIFWFAVVSHPFCYHFEPRLRTRTRIQWQCRLDNWCIATGSHKNSLPSFDICIWRYLKHWHVQTLQTVQSIKDHQRKNIEVLNSWRSPQDLCRSWKIYSSLGLRSLLLQRVFAQRKLKKWNTLFLIHPNSTVVHVTVCVFHYVLMPAQTRSSFCCTFIATLLYRIEIILLAPWPLAVKDSLRCFCFVVIRHKKVVVARCKNRASFVHCVEICHNLPHFGKMLVISCH